MMTQQAPDIPARQQAQQRADDIETFRRELARLDAEGVLSLDATTRQAIAAHHQALLARYAADHDIDRNQRARQLSLGMRAASLLGALALAASVFFLFYQFWGRFPEAAQAAILIVSALAGLGLTAYLQKRDSTGYFTKLAALVAFACFVLNVSMLGQIYNVTPSDQALLPWAAMALLLAYACDLRLLLGIGILCLIAFVSARVGSWYGIYWPNIGERPENFFVAALLLLSISRLTVNHRCTGFAAIYRVFGLLTALIPMLVLGQWGYFSYLDLAPKLVEGGYQLLGFTASTLAIWIGTRRDWPETANTGIVFFVLFLYTKFYDWWWTVMPKYLFFLVLGLSALLILLVLKRLRGVIGRAEPGETP